MNAVSEIQPTAGTAGSTPGALLRQEREQRGLTVQQVSEELHLDTWLVEALEQNRFLALGAPVYAKGHLRKYAVLLGLSPELILARYQEVAEPPPPLQLPPREALLTPEPMARGFDWRRVAASIDWRGIDWRPYGIIGGLLVVAGGLWLATNVLRSSGDAPQVATEQSGRAAAPAQNMPPQTPAAAATPLPASPATQPPAATARLQPPVTTAPAPVRAIPKPAPRPVDTSAPASPPATAAVRPAQPASTAPKSEPPKVAVAPPKAAVPARTPAPPPATSEPRLAAIKPPPDPPKPAATPATEPRVTSNPSTPAPAPSPEIPQVSLRLEFAVASWAEVYDGDGRRLLYAVGDPNRPRTVSGKPPLKVTLGQAGSVQARVNGRPIAIPRRIGQEAASFTVGANGSIR